MRDEMFDRDYQAGRDAMNAGVDRLFGAISDGFHQAIVGLSALNAIQFSAPWRRQARPTGDAC